MVLSPVFFTLWANHPVADKERWPQCATASLGIPDLSIATALLRQFYRPRGHGGCEANAKHKASAVVVAFLTPETAHSMWCLRGMTRHFNPHAKALTAAIREGQGRHFSEDLGMPESQRRNLPARSGRELLGLDIDAGGRHSPRTLARIIAAERAAGH
jgi:hypothetical protein